MLVNDIGKHGIYKVRFTICDEKLSTMNDGRNGGSAIRHCR